MGSQLGLLMLILATIAYSGSPYNTTKTTKSTSSVDTGSNEKIYSEYICTREPIFRPDGRPPASDCTLTTQRLPNESNDALFHIGGDPGIYQLPWIVTNFDCELTVDIDGFHLADFYNWLGVRETATNLNYGCRSSAYPYRTGGWTMTGNLGRINVSLAEPVPPPPAQSFRSNSTIGLVGILVNGTET